MSNLLSVQSNVLATNIILINNAREAEEARQRRMSNKGNDELYLMVDRDVDTVGRRVAELFSNWYYKDGAIYKKCLIFSFWAFFVTLLFCSFVSAMSLMIINIEFDRFGTGLWQSVISVRWIIAVAASLIISIIAGFAFGGDEMKDSICLEDVDGKTGVLVKIYNSAGYRNLHENDIHRLLTMLGHLF